MHKSNKHSLRMFINLNKNNKPNQPEGLKTEPRLSVLCLTTLDGACGHSG